MFVYRVRKYIGAYSAALSGRVDALVFSAGIGENSSIIRGLICEDMQVRGVDSFNVCSKQQQQQQQQQRGRLRYGVLRAAVLRAVGVSVDGCQTLSTLSYLAVGC
jgi:acetate kinase